MDRHTDRQKNKQTNDIKGEKKFYNEKIERKKT